MLRRFISETAGVTATEYCLLISLSGGTTFIFLNRYSDGIENLFTFFSLSLGV
jgi:Flp pilus assembly pilin Flp